jgi:TolB-like protein/tetratricopeptide (TPR) repeat protein
VMGTLRYMSPEQARGLDVDARTDIFSLGAVLYQLVTGRPPFDGATAYEVAAAVLTSEPPPIASSVPDIPPALDRVVAKALSKDRDARYQSMEALIADLEALRSPAPVSAPQSVPVSVPASNGRRWMLAAAAAVVVAVTGALGFALGFMGGGGDRPFESVAVLPLVHMGADADTEYLADGITETLINNLSQVSGLRVMSRSSVFRFKGQAADPQKVGQELQVDAVLAGRIEPRGDRFTINIELVSVADGRQLWGEQLTPALGDLLAVQAEVTRGVSERLRVRLTGEDERRLSQAPTRDPEAYREYLRGRFFWQKLTEASIAQAIESFLKAVQRDPEYAMAYVGLAESYTALGVDWLAPREAMPKAAAYANRALALDPNLPSAHAAMGIIKLTYEWDFPGAERELRYEGALASEAIESFTCALHYADPVGRNSDAIAALENALALDPLALPVNLELGCASYYGRRFDQAIRQFQGTLTLYPGHPFAIFELGRAYAQKGMYDEALAALATAGADARDWPPIVTETAYVQARAGNRDGARQLLAGLLEQRGKRYVDAYLLAGVAVGLGDIDRAFAWLDEAVEARSGYLPWLNVEPKWDLLRDDGRYGALAKRIGLPLPERVTK